MTGIAGVIEKTRKEAWHDVVLSRVLLALGTIPFLLLPERFARSLVLRLFPGLHASLRQSSYRVPCCPYPRLPNQKATLALLSAAPAPSLHVNTSALARALRWGILLPLTSRIALSGDEEDVWVRLERNAQRLVRSIPPHRRANTTVHVAIDRRDPAFDNDIARRRIGALFSALGNVDFAPVLAPVYGGALCWIWEVLARRAVEQGADMFVFLGDDVELHNHDWQADVEERFQEVAAEKGLPFGCACIAIRDDAYSVFPTFPVLHRAHFDVFGGELFPPEFRNQHGDPWLFEVYRRWGASRYTARASLTNGLGGAAIARYEKAGIDEWTTVVLDRGIDRLNAWPKFAAPDARRVICMDVVIPTFRCDLRALQKLCSMTATQPASLHTTIVVDNPDAKNIGAIHGLASYASNRTVRVHVMKENAGAAWARNTGLFQSIGDYAVLLDNDVSPEHDLLDAYCGAVSRHPGAGAYVGLTKLPLPQTLVQSAMAACRICYFFGVAEHLPHPPWGVSANLCVPARGNPVSFSRRFPKTGGGEDVDYCIRSQMHYKPCVAVPGAIALHDYWEAPFRQVARWANGDVLCLDAHPHATFRAPPN